MGSHDRAGDVGQLLVDGMHRAWSEARTVLAHVAAQPPRAFAELARA